MRAGRPRRCEAWRWTQAALHDVPGRHDGLIGKRRNDDTFTNRCASTLSNHSITATLRPSGVQMDSVNVQKLKVNLLKSKQTRRQAANKADGTGEEKRDAPPPPPGLPAARSHD